MIKILVTNPDNLSLPELCQAITNKLRTIKYKCIKIEVIDGEFWATLGMLPWIDPPLLRLVSELKIRNRLDIYA